MILFHNIVHTCTANCGPPSPPPTCHIISYVSTLEGAEATFVCRNTFLVGQQSLCKEVNITAVCSNEGNWEPISDDICSTELSGTIKLNCYKMYTIIILQVAL